MCSMKFKSAYYLMLLSEIPVNFVINQHNKPMVIALYHHKNRYSVLCACMCICVCICMRAFECVCMWCVKYVQVWCSAYSIYYACSMGVHMWSMLVSFVCTCMQEWQLVITWLIHIHVLMMLLLIYTKMMCYVTWTCDPRSLSHNLLLATHLCGLDIIAVSPQWHIIYVFN